MSAAYVITTMSGAILSWSRIMNVAIAITRMGATEPTILPVGVSPIVRATSAAIAARDRARDQEDQERREDVRQVREDRRHEVREGVDPEDRDRERDHAEEEHPEGHAADQPGRARGQPRDDRPPWPCVSVRSRPVRPRTFEIDAGHDLGDEVPDDQDQEGADQLRDEREDVREPVLDLVAHGV